MTEYTFIPGVDGDQFANWDDTAVWQGGVVPNSLDADVIFPLATYTSDGSVYESYVSILAGEEFLAHSVALDGAHLLIHGTLNITGSLTVGRYGEVDLDGGSLSIGSYASAGYDIQGYGTVVSTGDFNNTTSIIGSSNLLSLSVASFHNSGLVESYGSDAVVSITVTSPSGATTVFSAGALTGGAYETGQGGVLDLAFGGAITTADATITLDAGALSNSGIYSLDPSSQAFLSLQDTLQDIGSNGQLIVENSFSTTNELTVDGELTLFGNGGVYTGPLHVVAGGTVDGVGTVSGPIENDGLIIAKVPATLQPDGEPTAGDLVLKGSVTGTGIIEVGPGYVTDLIGINPPTPTVERAVLELAGPATENVLFADSNGMLILDNSADFSGTITPQVPGQFDDIVVLDNVSLSDVTAYTYVGDDKSGVLTIEEGSVTQTLRFEGDFTTADFQLSAGRQLLSNSPPSLDISIACYARGTSIRTEDGNVAVETLAIGDRVATFSGTHRPIKWIGRRGYSGRFLASNPAVQPILFKAGSLGRYQPRRDLRVSPKHAMFLDNVLVPAECLVNGTSIVRDIACTEIDYFHIELDSHDVLLAEDAPSESFVDDDSRAMFANAAEYATLHGTDAPAAPAYCAPRIEDGERLDRIRRGIEAASCATDVRPLRGHVDGFDGHIVQGWAQDPDAPDVPMCLEVLGDGVLLGRVVANLFRPDLRQAALGSGCHGFRLALERPYLGTVEVRRVADKAVLGMATARQAAA